MVADQQEQFIDVYPFSLREIPAEWWAQLFSGQPYAIDLTNFPVPCAGTSALRQFIYRRAKGMDVKVTVSANEALRMVYVQRLYPGAPVYAPHAARPAPAMVPLRGLRDGLPFIPPPGTPLPEPVFRVQRNPVPVPPQPPADLGELAAILARAGYQVNLPSPPAPAEVSASQPVARPDWKQSVHTGTWLPPGVPDIKGAFYEEGIEEQELRELAAVFFWMEAECSCGTEDLRRHEPECRVSGGAG